MYSCPNGTEQDCNDASPTTYPGALEACDGFDNNCDGILDDNSACDRSCDSPETVGQDNLLAATGLWPVIVWTGSGFGVVYRTDPDNGSPGQILFRRLDEFGNQIGETTQVTDTPSNYDNPALVWTGSHFTLAWEDIRHGNSEIYFNRLTPAGTKVGADVRLTNTPTASQGPSMVWTGGAYGVAWQDSLSGDEQIYFARLDALGDTIGKHVQVTNARFDSEAPSLAWAGVGYGVAWQDDRQTREIFFARLDNNGNKIGDDIQISATDFSQRPNLVWTGSEFGVVWMGRPNTSPNQTIIRQLFAARRQSRRSVFSPQRRFRRQG